MILVDRMIREAVEKGELGITEFDTECLQPASYDLRIGARVYSSSSLTPEKPIDLSANGGQLKIPPYAAAILQTYETLKMPANMLAHIGLKSGLARRGFFASTGPQVDPGFEGKLIVSLMNQSPVSHLIEYKETFLTIEFHRLDARPEKTYEGPYQRKTDITREILEDLVRLEGVSLSHVASQFTELSQHLKEWTDLASRFEEFLAFTAELREKEASPRPSRITSLTVPVTTLHPAPFELLGEIPIVLQPSGDDWIATFFDANINASGDTQEEAVANLKDVLVSMFKRFSQEPVNQLGPEPKRQLAVLRQFVREVQ